jgi:hypothetical protein
MVLDNDAESLEICTNTLFDRKKRGLRIEREITSVTTEEVK